MSKSFFKTKKFYVLLIILIAGGAWYYQYRNKAQVPVYETTKAERANLVQTVEATGNVQSLSDLSLRFETAGTIQSVSVIEGQTVAAGTILMKLKSADLDAAVASAQATLNQKLAGATEQDIAYYKAAVDSARASLQEAQADANSNGITEPTVSRIISSAYAASLPVIRSSLTKLDDGLTQADNILGIDNIYANASFRTTLSTLDINRLYTANDLYKKAKIVVAAANSSALMLDSSSQRTAIDNALKQTEAALISTGNLLSQVSSVLKATPPDLSFLQETLDAKKTIIETARAGINAQYTTVVAQEEAIANAKSNLAIKQAAYDQAVANLNAKLVTPREVDVAYYRAALAQAIVNRDKTILRAPQTGVVTNLPKKAGEFIATAETAVQILSPHYEVRVDIPETDVAKLSVGQTAKITLDAFGENASITGTIRSIDPASTDIQDVVYYRVSVSLTETNKAIKPGMTANVSIGTAKRENVLGLPLRSVRTRDDGAKYVKILGLNNVEIEKNVALGLKADLGKVEVLSGISEGDVVIISSSSGK